MEIIQVAFFAFTALFVFLLLKDNKSEMGFLVILAAGIGIFLYMIGQLAEVIEFIKDIANKANIDVVCIYDKYAVNDHVKIKSLTRHPIYNNKTLIDKINE